MMTATRVAHAELEGASPLLLTLKEAAAQLQVSDDTVRRRIADGTLPAVRLGPRTLRISVAALEGYIRDQESRQVPSQERRHGT